MIAALEDRPFMPLPMEAMSHIFQRFLHYLDSHDGARSALNAASNDLQSCAREINTIGRVVPIFDILDQIRFTQTVKDPDIYEESTYQGSLPLLELAALALTVIPPDGDKQDGACQIEDTSEAVQRVLELGGDMVDLVVVRRLLSAREEGNSRDALAFSASQREILVRSPTYEHIAERTLDLLFDDAQLNTLCHHHLGFTAQQACKLFSAIDERIDASINEYMNRHKRFRHLVESHPKFPKFDADAIPDHESIPAPVKALFGEAWAKLWYPIPEESMFHPSDLADATGLSIDCVERFLGAFTYMPPTSDAGDFILKAVDGPSPLRTCPILVDEHNRRFLIHGGIDMYAVREAIEEGLKNSPDWNVYDRCRAAYLEGDSLHLLTRMLPTACLHTQLEYYGPNPDKHESTGNPKSYSRKFECDGLLVIDDVALVVEAKAGAVRSRSRGGDAHALEQDLRKLITNASSQAKRLHDLIVADRGVYLRNRSWLDLSGVRNVYSVVVTLEDLSGLATIGSELITKNLLSADHVPWLVSLYDLHVVSDIVQRPAELILFLQRRTNPEIVQKYHAFDELDYFMVFLDGGLRGDDELGRQVFDLPGAHGDSVIAGHTPGSETVNVLGSHTEPLDAWYLYRRGDRSRPAPRPQLRTDPRIRVIVDALSDLQQSGWLSIGAALLDHDILSQGRIVSAIDDALDLTRSDGRNHTALCVGGGPLTEASTLIFSTVRSASTADPEMDGLARYVTAKKHQTQSVIGAGMMFDLVEPNVPKRSFYDNRTPGYDAELDRLVAQHNLQSDDNGAH